MSHSTDSRYRQAALELAREQTPGKSFGLHVTGRSMWPVLRPGDVVRVRPVEPMTLRRGDLVVVRCHEELFTHRLIAVGAGKWRTKGDNCYEADPPVAAPAILGQVVAIERGERRMDWSRRRWRVAHRLLGWLGSLQVSLCSRRLQPGWVRRVVAAPFRIIVYLIGVLWLR